MILDKIIESMANNVPGIVGVIIIVILFLKAQKNFIDDVKQISLNCHERTKEDREAFQTQMADFVSRQEKMADDYQRGMQDFAKSMGANGEILIRMEKALIQARLAKEA